MPNSAGIDAVRVFRRLSLQKSPDAQLLLDAHLKAAGSRLRILLTLQPCMHLYQLYLFV